CKRNDSLQVSAPGFKRGLLFLIVAVPVINCCYAALDVIEQFRYHEATNSHPGHVACRGSPQVVRNEAHPGAVANTVMGFVDSDPVPGTLSARKNPTCVDAERLDCVQ